MEDFECTGLWWLPEGDDQVSGTLRFNQGEGAVLELIGSLKDDFEFEYVHHEIIWGVTSKGKEITLYKCIERHCSINAPGLTCSSYKAQIVFVGHHFLNWDVIEFESITFEFPFLQQWLKITGLTYTIKQKENRILEIQAGYQPPNEIVLRLPEFTITFDCVLSYSMNKFESINMQQTFMLKVTPHDTPRDYNFFIEYVGNNLRNFFTFAIGTTVRPTSIIGTIKEETTDENFGAKSKHVYIFYQSLISNPSKNIDFDDMLFTYPDVKQHFDLYLLNWFQKNSILQPIYSLYFGTLMNPKIFIHHRFLNLVQGLESYHRRMFKGQYVDETTFRHIVDCISSAIPSTTSEFEKVLTDRFQYMNEFTLRTRLKELIDKNIDIFELVIGSTSQLIKDTVNTRNFFTHYDLRLEKKTKKGVDLYYICEQLKFIFIVCLLTEMGMHSDIIENVVKKNHQFNYLKRNLQDRIKQLTAT
ncbi:MAG: hypothetical protein KGZ63_12840 [Clostridiales bacterium]|jgi:hypothetical protein|nr:hypothetical protein [Clostridiales bacterium]